MIVGSYGIAAQVRPRFVKDLDIWIERSPDGAVRALEAVRAIGFDAHGLVAEDFCTNICLELGYIPTMIDVLNSFGPYKFHPAWARRIEAVVDDTMLSFGPLDVVVEMKRATTRRQDRGDLHAYDHGEYWGASIAERLAETERLRRAASDDHGDPDRPIAKAVRRKQLRTEEHPN